MAALTGIPNAIATDIALETAIEASVADSLKIDMAPGDILEGTSRGPTTTDHAAAEAANIEPNGNTIIDMPLAEIVIDEESALIPDITRLTLDSFKLTSEQGISAADVLILGDVSNMLDLHNMTIGAGISEWQRPQLSELTLDQYSFLADMTILEVADMARLHAKTVGDIPIVETAITTFLNHPVLIRERKVTLSRFLARYPEIGSIKLGLLELPEYHYSAIPKLHAVPITSIPRWQQLKVSSIAGFRGIPIHQNLQIEGEIVTLTTDRTEQRVEIQLRQNAGSVATWAEDLNQNAIQPFNSFFLQPTLAVEKIALSAYFRTCDISSAHCQFIGPFSYPDYKIGESFYISQADWESVLVQENKDIEFRREQAVSANLPAATDPFFSELIFKTVGVGMLIIFGLGTPSLLWLLSKHRGNQS